MNSFRAVERALDYEAQRQYREWQETGRKLGDAPKQTRGWDDAAGVTRGQRSKEESSDYRYFPDPDLVPVTITAERSRRSPRSRSANCRPRLRQRLEADYALSAYDADVLVNQGRPVVDYFLDVADATRRRQGGRATGSRKTCCERSKNAASTIDAMPVAQRSLGRPDRENQVGRNSQPASPRGFPDHAGHRASTSTAAMSAVGIAAVDESELIALCQKLLERIPRPSPTSRPEKLKPSVHSSARQEAKSQRGPQPRPRNLFRIDSKRSDLTHSHSTGRCRWPPRLPTARQSSRSRPISAKAAATSPR